MHCDEEVKYAAEFLDQMKDLFARGYASREIARKIGINPLTVRKRLREAGVDLGGSGRKRQITDEYIDMARKLRNEGFEWAKISDKIGFSERQLQRYIYGK